MAGAKRKPRERKRIAQKTRLIVLTECGYRCAVPTCRTILALDLHHLWEVSAGGSDEASNLVALCPTCHALYHRGTIHEDAIYAYKSMLVSLTRAFDIEAVDRLLFIDKCEKDFLVVSGDGLVKFDRLIAAGLADMVQKANNNFQLVTYAVNISESGRKIVSAWKSGDRARIDNALAAQNLDVD